MRTLALLVSSLSLLLVAGSVATAAGRDDKPPKAAKPDKADRGKPDSAKEDKADKDVPGQGDENRAVPEHPHGAPPGLAKEPGDPAAPGLPEPPALGQSVGFKPVANGGTPRVKLPGSDEWTTIGEGETVPLGSTVDATDALVEIVAEADSAGTRQNAVVYGSVFRVSQYTPVGEPAPVVEIALKGDFDDCKDDGDDDPADRLKARAARKKRGKAGIVRGLWATGKGRFRTRGRHSAATVRGTRWAIVDRCHSTTVKVFEGVVDVMDFELDRVFSVRAGQRHVARKRS